MSQHPMTVTGHLTHDPRIVRLREGSVKCTIRVASSRRVRDSKDPAVWKDTDLLFLDVEVWGQFALNVAKSLRKGMPVIVVGSLMTNQWQDKDGENQARVIMRATFVGLDLNRYAVASRKNEVVLNEVGIPGFGGEGIVIDIPLDEDYYEPPTASSDAADSSAAQDLNGQPARDPNLHDQARAGMNMGASSDPHRDYGPGEPNRFESHRFERGAEQSAEPAAGQPAGGKSAGEVDGKSGDRAGNTTTAQPAKKVTASV